MANQNEFKKELDEIRELIMQADDLAIERNEQLLDELKRLTGLSMGSNISAKKQNVALENLTDEITR